MSKRPYELLARFNDDGSVRGVSVKWITNVDGIDYEGPPVPLADESNPVFSQFAAAFAAAAVTERDALMQQNSELSSERNRLLSEIADLNSQVASLQVQLAPLASDPRHVSPWDFAGLFLDSEVVAIELSDVPEVILARTKLKTITTFVDLDSPLTMSFVGGLEAVGLIGPGRTNQILAGIPPAN